MLYTLIEIQNYFDNLGYTIEPGYGHLAFIKSDGKYVSIQLSDLAGTLEQMKEEVERRFQVGIEYEASQNTN